MAQRPEHPEREADVDRERRETTDLGYRDTEEERAYEQAQRSETPSADPGTSSEDAGPDDASSAGGG